MSIDTKIDSWKEQLLDLTRRNNMVDFSATKTKSLPTENTDLSTLASELAKENTLYVYQPDPDTYETAHTDSGAGESNSAAESENDLQSLARDIVGTEEDEEPTEEELPDDSDAGTELDTEKTRPPNELISIRSPSKTENSLYNISLNQRQFLQEKGVDTLYLTLGMLEWFSVDYSDSKLRSPLFMVSVSLERTTVSDEERHDYELSYDEEVLINPALRKMMRADFEIELPTDEDVNITNIDATIDEIKNRISGRSRWAVVDEVILGIFDFSKLSLYNDLEENRETIKTNPIVKALNDDTSDLNADASGVPDPEDLDDAVDPTEMFQVLEADSSQQHAIEAAKSGVSFVLQGPPGTGKSQTIANIIAEKLAAGERVLFVSEKQAALEVVQNRLADVGLSRFCLSVHGKKASKDEVLSSLETELNSDPIKSPTNRPQKLGKLRKRRSELNEYGDLLQREFGEIQTTAYDAHGIVSNLSDVPTPDWSVDDPLHITQEGFEGAIAELKRLAQYEEQWAKIDTHPWRATTLDQWQIDTADRMRETLREQQAVIKEIEEFTDELAEVIGISCNSIVEFEECLETLELVANRPAIDWSDRFFDERFVRQADQLHSLAEASRELADLRASLDEHYKQSLYQENGTSLHAELSSYGIFRYIQPSYYRLKRRILSHATDEYAPGLDELKDDLQALMRVQELEETIEEYEQLIRHLGYLYDGTATDWDTVLAVRDWVERVSALDHIETAELEQAVCENDLPVDSYLDRASKLFDRWQSASEFFRTSMVPEQITTATGTSLYADSFERTQAKLASLESELHRLQGWVQFADQLQNVRNASYGGFVDAARAADISADELVDSFRKAFYTDFLNRIYAETPFGEFSSEELERAMQDFRRLDKKQQELAKVEIQHRVTRQRPQMDLEHASSSQQMLLRREIQKQRRRKPLRVLFDEAGEMITRLKPCFMMSPLSVAQYLRTDSISFDCVIFDEASQIMPQDAISSLIRAEQAIITGDTKQLPPTSFFRADVETRDEVRDDLESILDEAAAVLPEMYLRWHYRSRTDELIAFSNQQYYDGRLNTFPENQPDVKTGVEFDYVEGGVYDRGGSRRNMPEAEHVVDRVQEFAADYPDKSLGIVAFSQAQEQAIRDVIEERRRDDPTLDRFVDETDALEGFFVKNLESVQGDERDVMMFSIGYGPDRAGKISMNFGPLNKDGGERRLNVAVTRARERNIVISSLLPGDIDLSSTSARGVKDFKTYLEYAQKGKRALIRDDNTTQTLQFDSTFEEAVYTALENEGYDVDTQVSSAGYSVDLGIKHPNRPGEYVLGIECDGAAYHSSKTARDRDRTRQLILEDLGWTIHRIWSPDWASNQERELREIEEKVKAQVEGVSDEPTNPVDVDIAESTPEPMSPAQLDGGLTHFETYAEPRLKMLGDPDFEDISKRKLGGEIVRIVNENGPIKEDEALKLVVQQWQFARVGKSMRRRLSGIVRQLEGNELVRDDDFLWPTGMDSIPVRINDGDASRSADGIPRSEFAKAAYTILEQGIAMTREDLVLETARKFGWQRRGKQITARLNEAIDLLVDLDAVEEGEQVEPQSIDIDAALLDRVY